MFFSILVLLCIVLLGITLGSTLLYRRFVLDFKQNKESELLAIADLKVNELDEWRQERLKDARFYQINRSFALLVQSYFEHPHDSQIASELNSWLSPTLHSHHYQAFLLDSSGSVQLTLPRKQQNLDRQDTLYAREALRTQQITFTDFHRSESGNRIEISLMIPLRKADGSTKPLGVLFWQIDPESKLYPILRRWPTPSRSAESLLVRREGENVLYLNNLRFDDDAALRRRVPLTAQTVPAVKAVLGQDGISEGYDYRGVRVVAALRAVPHSPWFLETRMDYAELYAPIRQRIQELAAFVAILVLTAGLSVALFWQRQRSHHFRQLFEAKAAREASETFARDVLDSMAAHIAVLDAQCNITSVNSAWRCFAHDNDGTLMPNAGVGLNYVQICDAVPQHSPDADTAQQMKAGLLAVRQGSLKHFRMEYPCDSPLEKRWFDVSVSSLHGPKGGFVVVHNDISQRRLIENALRDSEARFRHAVEKAPFPIMIYAEDGEVLSVNRVLTKLTGYQLKEIKTLNQWVKVAYPAGSAPTREEVLASFDATEPIVKERNYLGKDGSQLTGIVSAVSLGRLPDGRKIAICMAVDVTERVEAQKRIRQLSQAIEQSPVSVVITDKDGQIAYVNPKFCEITGYSQEEALNQNPRILKSGETPEERYKQMWETLVSGREWCGELRNRKKNGELYWEAACIAPIVDEHGEITHYVAVKEDITARKQMEEELRRSHEELEQRVERRTAELASINAELQVATEAADAANRAKSEFLSRMSHELRTPLNAILGFGQLLEMEAGDVSYEMVESVDHILKSGRHLLDLINEILDISRIEAGRLALSLETVPVAQIVREALDLVHPLAFKNDIHLINDLPEQCPRAFIADRQRVIQVLLNLLSNAVKYNHHGGSVTISYRLNEADLGICVSDSGPGITPDDLGKLFSPFERLNADKSGIEGTGLGLAISKHLAELMSGTLTVESVRGKGSTFCLTLPMDKSIVIHESEGGKADQEQDSLCIETKAEAERHFKVLSIEDNLSNAHLITAILAQRPEVDLLHAMQGSIGLELAQQHRPNLILLDLNLPDLHGSEVLRRLRSAPETESIPIIVISADATKSQIDRLISGGAKAYLTKPINVRDFLRVINEELNTQKTDLSLN